MNYLKRQRVMRSTAYPSFANIQAKNGFGVFAANKRRIIVEDVAGG